MMQSKWGNKKDSDSDLDFDDDDEDITESNVTSSLQPSDKKPAAVARVPVDVNDMIKKLISPACRNIGLQGEITNDQIT